MGSYSHRHRCHTPQTSLHQVRKLERCLRFILLSRGTRDKRVIPSIKSATSISDANSVPSDPFLNWNWQNLWKSEKISGSGIFLGANSSSRHFLNLEYGTVAAVKLVLLLLTCCGWLFSGYQTKRDTFNDSFSYWVNNYWCELTYTSARSCQFQS